ncbi:hypothetical protein ACFLYV_02650 [Chloroflexota bacterium]
MSKEKAIETFTKEFDEPTFVNLSVLCECPEGLRSIEVLESKDYYDEERGFYERIQVERCDGCNVQASFHWVLLEAHGVD